MSDDQKTDTLVDSWIRYIKNHQFLALLFLLALGFIGLATLVDGWLKLSAFAKIESISIQSSRVVNLSYDTEIRSVYYFGHSMPAPFFARAYWDVTVTNNGDRDFSILQYEIKPIVSSLPQTGPYGEPYAQGLFDDSGKAVELPITIAAGHALRIRVRTWVVISPNNIGPEVTRHWSNGGPPGKLLMSDLFYEYFAAYGVDFFGNKVSPGPDGILPEESPNLKNQELQLRLITGRGSKVTNKLKWY